MQATNLVRNILIGLATMGVMADGPAMAAARTTSPVKKTLPAGTILDIKLSPTNSFMGRVVDHTGAPIAGASVSVTQGRTEVARVTTDKQGDYTIENLKGGVYSVGSGATVGNYRFWTENAAPPSAKPKALLVLGENGVRGQYGMCDIDCCFWLLVGAAVVAGVIIGVLALTKADDDHPVLPPPASP